MKHAYKTYEEYNEAAKDLSSLVSFMITLCSKPKGIFEIETFESEREFTAAVRRKRK